MMSSNMWKRAGESFKQLQRKSAFSLNCYTVRRSYDRNFSSLATETKSKSKGLQPNPQIEAIRKTGRSIYMDMQATTPLDPRVLDAMLPLFTETFGNPHSRTHIYGWESEHLVEDARRKVAEIIGASDPKEIIFTSGATESNNIALKGVSKFYKKGSAPKTMVITTVTEHKCVLDSCRSLEEFDNFEVVYLPVQKNGLVDLELLDKTLEKNAHKVSVVSVMAVNNEIGVVQPLAEIGKLCRKHKVWFHTDCAQAVGKIPLDVNAMNIDLMSISGHKLYGPKGIGALYVRRRPRVRLEPIISGGGQERGMRSGTLPAPLIVGLGAACEIAKDEMERDNRHVRRLFDRLYDGIRQKIPEVYLNGDLKSRYHGNLNISFAYVEGESLLMALKDVACSSGSACTSASLEPSYVLRALGVDEDLAHTSIRFGIGRFTTEEEIDHSIELLSQNVGRLRDMSPLWEMKQEGIDIKSIQWAQDK
eukprot:TRINITY_DN4507_c0_g1_i1.p1 TRINITY_DN4507_c0_g1~~TRINITY_DN4507_c0_g1_i1.p1  ORF type:complete len:476 (-),score=119.71 TRINITY_DN4507_c0_g1_i1:49-1476(-)